LASVVRVVVCLAVRLARDEGVHRFPRGEAAGEVIVRHGGVGGAPTLHGAVLVDDGDAEVLGVADDGAEDPGIFLEVFLEAAILRAEFVVVADEGANPDVVLVAAAEVGDADELQEVVLVERALGGVAADEVLVGADGEAEPLAVAGGDQAPRVIGAEGFVVDVRGDVVGAGAVAAEYAEFHALRADLFGPRDDLVQGERFECRCHDPDGIVHGESFLLLRSSSISRAMVHIRSGI